MTASSATSHAIQRAAQRFGMSLTASVATEIWANIESARRSGNRAPLACLIDRQHHHDHYRERWIVSAAGTVLQVVVPAPVLITILPADAKRNRP